MSQLIEVELFWDGDGWYYANQNNSERLGGPHILIHDAWKEADSQGLRVIRVLQTRGLRGYRRC